VQPGPIDTDANPDGGDFAESLKLVTTQGRYGHTTDVASLVSFLAGPESGYITGANLNVDGGFHCLTSHAAHLGGEEIRSAADALMPGGRMVSIMYPPASRI